jgi:hypothetical protein
MLRRLTSGRGAQPETGSRAHAALVERGLCGHADNQNELARVLRSRDRSALPAALEANYDLAW